MPKRRNLDREGLEIYLVNLLLAYRPLLQIGALFLLVFAVFAFTLSPLAGLVSLILAFFVVSMTFSYKLTLYIAKFGAWLGTLGRDNQ